MSAESARAFCVVMMSDEDFRAKLAYIHPEQDEYYERVQFMKYFGDKK
jgi:hypothetical protein